MLGPTAHTELSRATICLRPTSGPTFGWRGSTIQST